MSFGPQLCHRNGITPLFFVVHDPSPVSLAVAAIGGPAIYYAAATKTLDWTRAVAVFVPATGLLLGHTHLDRLLAVPLITLGLAYQHFLGPCVR